MTQSEYPTTASGTATRDRLQHFVVEALAGRPQCRRRLVFKGGTLLRVCWREDYRYSEDLDFDWVADPAESREELGHFIRAALTDASSAARADLDLRDHRGRLAVTWPAPDGQPGVIRIDVSRRAHPSYSPATRDWVVRRRYPGLTGRHAITGYTLEAVLAAKLACLAEPDRVAPRDFFDVDELLRSGEVDVHAALGSFLALRYPPPLTRPHGNQLHEALLGPGYQHHETLVSRWSASATRGVVPPDRLDFAAIFDSVDARLAAAVPADPGRPPALPTHPQGA